MFIKDNWSKAIVHLILSCPLEYGMNGATGLKYEALKDFVKWNTPQGYSVEETQKEYVPLLLNLGRYYCNSLTTNAKRN